MKLTTKGRYAVMAMADLALFKDSGPINLTDISLRQNISLAYLEQIFIKLKKNNLVKSIRGAKGGYVLEISPENIKISNIIAAVDEEVKTLNKEMSVEPRKNIQDILPNLTRSEREQIMTGTHQKCFMKAFGQLDCEHNFVEDTITNTDVRCCEKCELWEDDQLEEE